MSIMMVSISSFAAFHVLLLIHIDLISVVSGQADEAVECGNLSIADLTASSFTVEWDGPDSTSYTIHLTEQETGKVSYFFAIQLLQASFIGLHPYYNYQLNITIVYDPMNVTVCDSEIILTEQAAPSGAPLMLSHFETNSTVNISWSPPLVELQNGLITHYVVKLVSGQEMPSDFHVNDTWIVLEELRPFTNYTVSVSAFTEEGEGPPSDEYTFLTAEDAPFSAPTNISLQSSSSTSLTLTWHPPPIKDRNGIIRIYFIDILGVDNPEILTANSSLTTTTIDGLLPYRMYNISVSTYTVALGPFSHPMTLTTEQSAPSGHPVNVSITSINSTSVTLSWGPPDPSERNGIITGYIVQLNSTSDNYTVQTQRTSTSISGLRPYSNYTIAVTAETKVGRGPYSMILVFETLQDAPEAPPRNISYSSVSSTGFTLSWQPPEGYKTNGIITFYVIEVYEVETMTTYHFNTTSPRMEFSHLHPAYRYQVRVAAYTVAMGILSQTISIVLDEDVPSGVPQSFEVIKLTSRSVTLSWEPPLPSERNGDIINYTILLVPSHNSAGYSLYSAKTTHTFTGLIPNTSYYAQIAAGTEVGFGNFSNKLPFSTDEDAPSRPPSITSSEALDPSTAILLWDPPPSNSLNGVVRYYLIHTQDERGHVTLSEERMRHFAVIVSLTPAVTYSFKVAAVTVGQGPYSKTVDLKMPEDSPEAEPQNIMGRFINDNTLSLTWEPPLAHFGTITNYLVRLADLSIPKIYQYDTGTDQTDIVLTGHRINTSYAISVAAVNEQGIGPFSHAIYIINSNLSRSSNACIMNKYTTNTDQLALSTESPTQHDDSSLESYKVVTYTMLGVIVILIMILVASASVIGYNRFKQRRRILLPPPAVDGINETNSKPVKCDTNITETNMQNISGSATQSTYEVVMNYHNEDD